MDRGKLRAGTYAKFAVEPASQLPEDLDGGGLLTGGRQGCHQMSMGRLVERLAGAHVPQMRHWPLVPADPHGGTGEPQHHVTAAARGLRGGRVALEQINVGNHVTTPKTKRSLVQRAREAEFTPAACCVGVPRQLTELSQIQVDPIA